VIAPEVYGPYTTIYKSSGDLDDIFYALTGSTGMYGSASVDSTYIKAHRSAAGKGGAFNNAIGRSRGGQTTKIHALTDEIGRPRALLITAGNVHDREGARSLLAMGHQPKRLLADRAYDAGSLREMLAGRRAVIRQTRRASILIAMTKLPTRDAISSRECSAALKTSGASQPAMTNEPISSSLQSSWPQL
jgi:transposase